MVRSAPPSHLRHGDDLSQDAQLVVEGSEVSTKQREPASSWTNWSNWTVGEAGSRCVDVDLYQSNGSISKYGMKA